MAIERRFDGSRRVMLCAAVLSLIVCSTLEAAKTKKVTLKSGETFDVPVERGFPVRFESGDIRVLDLGPTATLMNVTEQPPWVWLFQAQLKTVGAFFVTVTTPMDGSVRTTFECSDPGPIKARFFPQAEYPTVWAGFDDAGDHWFPFRFSFEEKGGGKQFEFTQWARVDPRTLKEIQAQIEWAREALRGTEQKHK